MDEVLKFFSSNFVGNTIAIVGVLIAIVTLIFAVYFGFKSNKGKTPKNIKAKNKSVALGDGASNNEINIDSSDRKK